MEKTGSKRTNPRSSGNGRVITKKSVRYDESELLARAKEGDQKAFTALYDKHKEAVQQLIRTLVTQRKGLGEADIDDLLQQTFIKAFESIGGFRPQENVNRKSGRPASFKTWVLAIAENNVTDAYRRAKKILEDKTIDSDDRFGSGADAPVTATPEEDMIISEGTQSVLDALKKLPPTLYDAIMLYGVEEYGYVEIAKELGITVTNAKVRIKRAKDEFAKMIKDHPIAQRRIKKSFGDKK